MRHLVPLLLSVVLTSPVVFAADAPEVKKETPAAKKEAKPISAAWKKQSVLTTMEAVADWQLEHPSRHSKTDWTQGAGYAGIMALSRISADSRYEQAMLKMGETNEWKLGKRVYHADDHCVAQTYLELYAKYKKPEMIAPTKERFIIANPKTSNLVHKGASAGHRWTWCDALFMAPPAFAKLWQATGDEKYLAFMDSEWKVTSDYLYDKEEHLYYRDDRYFEKREPNGKKVFWSRGNGWVMGGLARVLEILPKDNKYRPFYETQYKDMAAKILSIQRPSGFWSTSLLDPDRISQNETSGTGFFCYALAWGINQGLLEKDKYLPAVKKSWDALVSCVDKDGKLTHVQPIAADPYKFPADRTEIYGVGAFLLSGAEIYKLAD
ncbi:MAG: glycoside hydrolase family 88 protein [Puniceicoccales bacterium]|jgi:rhamnogalacturonyl hydrolase YesR|nr:glycoside hydrolase family 88 protein [Puniceicoccales bacterium]